MPWCTTHQRHYYGTSCYACPADNAGQVGIDSSLDLDVGIGGGGLAVDLSDGDLVVDGIDTGLEL